MPHSTHDIRDRFTLDPVKNQIPLSIYYCVITLIINIIINNNFLIKFKQEERKK